MAKNRYGNLDGIRGYACIIIVLKHVLANGNFGLTGPALEKFVVLITMTKFVYLFMIVSAFSMCCGYYERFQNGTIDLESFYKKRYTRMWPFFAFLCTLELIVEHNLTSLYEWIADLTLAFGLLPNANISVVGVGWFLGVIFVFYMLFPFFIFLMKNRKRAWMVLGVTVLLNILCQVYFLNGDHVVEGYDARTNFLFCSMFFAAGGLMYLYRTEIEAAAMKYKIPLLILTLAAIVFYYTVNASDYTTLVIFCLITALGMAGGNVAKAIFQNKVIRFMNTVSMEMFLCHMFVFRAIEKLGLLHITRFEFLNYMLVFIATLCGATAFAYVAKTAIEKAMKMIKR